MNSLADIIFANTKNYQGYVDERFQDLAFNGDKSKRK